MAGEFVLSLTTGNTPYVVLLNSDGQAFNTSTNLLEAFDELNWVDYAITLSELGTSGVYQGSAPASLPAGRYNVLAYNQLGASNPATTDISLGGGILEWNGQEEVGVVNAGDAYDVDSNVNLRQALSIILAAVAGETSGFLGSNPASGAQFLGTDGSTIRITADVDANGNRTNITINPPA